MRVTLHHLGTGVFVLIALVVAAGVCLSFAINAAANDLHAQATLARGASPETLRTAAGAWLSGMLAADVQAADAPIQDARASDLDHRADRIRELAAAASVAGLVVGLATAKPENRMPAAQSANNGLANTRSNGTV